MYFLGDISPWNLSFLVPWKNIAKLPLGSRSRASSHGGGCRSSIVSEACLTCPVASGVCRQNCLCVPMLHCRDSGNNCVLGENPIVQSKSMRIQIEVVSRRWEVSSLTRFPVGVIIIWAWNTVRRIADIAEVWWICIDRAIIWLWRAANEAWCTTPERILSSCLWVSYRGSLLWLLTSYCLRDCYCSPWSSSDCDWRKRQSGG